MPWRKSSYSDPQGECTEVAPLRGQIAARDSKNPELGFLVFSRTGFGSLLQGLKDNA